MKDRGISSKGGGTLGVASMKGGVALGVRPMDIDAVGIVTMGIACVDTLGLIPTGVSLRVWSPEGGVSRPSLPMSGREL